MHSFGANSTLSVVSLNAERHSFNVMLKVVMLGIVAPNSEAVFLVVSDPSMNEL
jgi:hypothetical protein